MVKVGLFDQKTTKLLDVTRDSGLYFRIMFRDLDKMSLSNKQFTRLVRTNGVKSCVSFEEIDGLRQLTRVRLGKYLLKLRHQDWKRMNHIKEIT